MHDAVEVNCKTGGTTKIKAQMSSIWAKGGMSDDCLCYLT